uniref:Uncharacterized protein n=1 Tax=Pediastrum duplex TaxID=3105 RepID=A0A1W5RNP7_PEDDU|nr:hypothetical protein [Pediastrum duplex]AQU64446.1 hypothetical protein [Pediastrum duplex]
MRKLPLTQQNFTKAYTSVCHLCQQGATSPKYAENARVTIYGIDLRVGDLRQACIIHKTTVRKLARALQNDIVKVATIRMMEGNLSKLYKLENPNYNKQDLVWVSDFQTFNDNTAMPDHVRTWLLENYRNRFRPSSKVRNADIMED